MQEATGIELCRQIRTFDQTTPILICSGAVTQADREAGALAGAQGYIGKPFKSAELIGALRSFLFENLEKSVRGPTSMRSSDDDSVLARK